MLNGIFLVLVVASVLLAAFTGKLDALTQAALQSANFAVMDVALKLVGVMALFLGVMKIAEDAGLMRVLARAVAPVFRRLFPSVPPEHPAMSAMLLNIVCNMLGLANAATPFGIKAIEELDRLNSRKGTATDAMVLFLAINTSGLALLPTGVIGIRASLGSADPGGIFVTTWFASGCATAVGILASFGLARLPAYRRTAPPVVPDAAEDARDDGALERELSKVEDRAAASGRVDARPRGGRWVALAAAATYLVAAALFLMRADGSVGDRLTRLASYWIIPAILAGVALFGWVRGVRVYDSLVEGAKEGFQVAIRIIPYLVAILTAVGMLRASGGIDLIAHGLAGLAGRLGISAQTLAEALPMALVRPLSGSGALGVMTDVMRQHGPDSFLGYLVSTFQGSTETTFYVLAVYFGAVGVRRTRHAVPACLSADAAGILAAVAIVTVLFG